MAKRSTKRLNKRNVDNLPLPAGKFCERTFDDDLTGFGVAAYPTGRKVFFVQYGPNKRRRRMIIGPYGALTVEQARIEAKKLLGEVAAGLDPLEVVRERRAGEELTFSKWVEEYLERVQHRRRSVRDDRRLLKMAETRFGSKPLVQVATSDIRALFDSLTKSGTKPKTKQEGTPIQANRWLAAIRSCLQEAWRDGKLPDNPAKRIKPNSENEPRSRVLTDDEMNRIMKAVIKEPDANVRAVFVLLIETGARVSEARRAEWEHFDLERGIWTIPSSHSKSKRKKILPLNMTVLTLLASMDRSERFLLPGKDPNKPRADVKRPWERIKEASKLEDFVIHDIRRTFGLRIARQAGVHMASKLLGHSDISVTAKVYAPLDLEELRRAVEGSEASEAPRLQSESHDGEPQT